MRLVEKSAVEDVEKSAVEEAKFAEDAPTRGFGLAGGLRCQNLVRISAL